MALLQAILKDIAKRYIHYNFVVTKISNVYWEGKLRGEVICKFHYFKDHQGYRAKNIWTDEQYRSIGLGTRMVKEAIKVYGKVLICSLSRAEFNQEKVKVDTKPNDTRYPIDDSLLIFANKCIEKNIIKQEWVRNPFD